MPNTLPVSNTYFKTPAQNPVKRTVTGEESTVIKAVATKVLTTVPNMDFFTNAVTFDLRYRFIKIIGKGSFGIVILACDTTSNANVVIKIAKERKKNSTLEQEAKDLKLLNETDPLHTVNFLFSQTIDTNTYMRDNEVFQTSPRAIIVSEYGGVNAYQCVTKKKGKHRFRDFMHLFCQAIAFWKALKKSSLVQRDIKPENMLIQGPFETPGSLKFIDPCYVKKEGETCSSWEVTTRNYRAPSTLFKKYTNAEVPFALATSFYDMLTGHVLFPGTDSSSSVANMRQHMQTVFDTFGFPKDNFFLSLPKETFSLFFKKALPKKSGSKTGYSFKSPSSKKRSSTGSKAGTSRLDTVRVNIRSSLLSRFRCSNSSLGLIEKEVGVVFRALVTNRSITPDDVLKMPLFQRYPNIVKKHLGPGNDSSPLSLAGSA